MFPTSFLTFFLFLMLLRHAQRQHVKVVVFADRPRPPPSPPPVGGQRRPGQQQRRPPDACGQLVGDGCRSKVQVLAGRVPAHVRLQATAAGCPRRGEAADARIPAATPPPPATATAPPPATATAATGRRRRRGRVAEDPRQAAHPAAGHVVQRPRRAAHRDVGPRA